MMLTNLHNALGSSKTIRVDLIPQSRKGGRLDDGGGCDGEVRREPGFVVVLAAPGEFHVWADVGNGRRELHDIYRRSSGLGLVRDGDFSSEG